MTTFWRALLLIGFGLGVTWAATRIGGGPPTVFNTLDDGAAATGAPEPAPDATPPPAAGDEPSPADIDAQIRQAEEALGGRVDPDKELAVDPLRADLPIPLPSDI